MHFINARKILQLKLCLCLIYLSHIVHLLCLSTFSEYLCTYCTLTCTI